MSPLTNKEIEELQRKLAVMINSLSKMNVSSGPGMKGPLIPNPTNQGAVGVASARPSTRKTRKARSSGTAGNASSSIELKRIHWALPGFSAPTLHLMYPNGKETLCGLRVASSIPPRFTRRRCMKCPKTYLRLIAEEYVP